MDELNMNVHRLLQSQINPVLRKCGSSHEQGLVNMFEKKGVILTSLKAGASLDDAETDGIEVLINLTLNSEHHQVGAEEVVLANEEESDQLLEFTTDPGQLAIVQQGMTSLGYKIEEVDFIRHHMQTKISLNFRQEWFIFHRPQLNYHHLSREH